MKIALAALAMWPCLAAEPCAECHSQIVQSYRATAMGRSFSRAENIPQGSYYHAASDTHFEMIERSGKYFQRRFQTGFGGAEANIDEKQIDYVMGSGTHVRTFLHRTASGALQELPLAWYAENGGAFAMNPGYDTPSQPNARRKITYECMFCHNAYAQVPSGRSDTIFSGALPEGIDCERCHGPGDRHIAAAKSGAPRDAVRAAIVNPARLPRERRLELCMQCHLETTSFPFPHSIRKFDRAAFSYRPGEPLADFMLFFDHPERDRFEIDSAAYRLRMSPCFLKSGALECTTCHDPHKSASLASIDRACQGCHTRIAAEHRARTGCASCHMPRRRTDDVVHAVMTDHRIVRRAPTSATTQRAEPHGAETFYRGPVLPYFPASVDDLYLALAQVIEKNNLDRGVPQLEAAVRKFKPERAEFYAALADAWTARQQPARAIPFYQEALRRDPKYLAAAIGLGGALEKSGDLPGSAESFQRATAIDSSDALAWQQLGDVLWKQHRNSEAIAALNHAVELDPEMPEARYTLGLALAVEPAARGAAESSFREAIRLRPDDAAAHMNLAILLFEKNHPDEAAFHFERALRYQPGYSLGHLNYGKMLAATGNRTAAILHFRKAAVSENPEIRRAALALLGK